MSNEHTAQIELLSLSRAYDQLRVDLAADGSVLAWTYLIEPDFALDLLRPHCDHSAFYSIVDHRQRGIAAQLRQQLPLFTARSWSYNRTMHEKTFIFPQHNIVWLGSHNMTRGSYTLSSNRAARIVSEGLTRALVLDWENQWARSRPVPTLAQKSH